MTNPISHIRTIVTQQSLEELAQKQNAAASSSEDEPTTSTPYASDAIPRLNLFQESSSDTVPTTSSIYAQSVLNFSEKDSESPSTASSRTGEFIVTEDHSIANSKRYYLQDEPHTNKGISNAPTTMQPCESEKKSFEPTTMQLFDPEMPPAKKTHWYDCFVCCCQSRERT